ncbi:hypothetical protein HNQ51_000662 [Inhella inkyongensis]|uniref:Exo-alpha-sialidase n=1 Tax=Inhella inkyongensis TaxID=392593 RepID=A0A840S4D6_9BURK|nr:exo-alpha-sialidase [Inhella inkyongensis]MBB5203369.1 hypothetical protein [Inhella inkyongensis]
MNRDDRAWVATRKGLFELRRQPQGWAIDRVHFLAEPVSMVLPPDASGFMLAALNLGHFGVKLQASDDAGQSWREVACPAYPPQPEEPKQPGREHAASPSAGVGGSSGAPSVPPQPFPWKLGLIWSLERAIDGSLWCGTLPGGLFVSRDRGASWALVESLWNLPQRLEWFGGGYPEPGIHSICPHPQDAQDLLVGISCGGVWRTRDGGATWAVHTNGMRADFMPPERAEDPNIQDPHRVVRCAAAPEVLWTQHHCGIWRSADHAQRWQELKAQPSSFGFAVAAHPRDPNTAWFAPAVKDERRIPVDAALCVTRTRDGGQSFEVLRQGLPQQHCYDLIYRHGLVVGADGQTLLMGSTTGSLWASADAGERWQAVNTQLPPIYAVVMG